MSYFAFKNIFLPFLGTTLGSACVFFMKNKINEKIQKSLLGFASGVMIAASVWSLILPSIDKSAHLGALSFLPAFIGLWLGFFAMLITDKVLPEPQEKNSTEKKSMLFMAVTIHNFPEGMAVGAAISAVISGASHISMASVFVLSVGIAIQNIPEGSIISMPFASKGKVKAFLYGVLSGLAEPLGAIITIIFASFVTPTLPYMLSFAAGAMLFVSVSELIPQMTDNKKSYIGTMMFAFGFSIMMCLDVALG